MTAICKLLEWDSGFFGVRIGRVEAHRLRAGDVPLIRQWALDNRIECLYFLAVGDDPATVRVAEDAGFRLVDLRVTLERMLNEEIPRPALKAGTIRPARAADVPALKAIAGVVHRDTRFYSDPHFPRELSSKLYATWIEKSCAGGADRVFVAELEGQAMGYVACRRRPERVGEIGLIGVQPSVPGRGLGRGLLVRALTWFQEQGLVRATAATQGRNARGQRLYQRNGFVTQSVELWYHKWFASGAP